LCICPGCSPSPASFANFFFYGPSLLLFLEFLLVSLVKGPLVSQTQVCASVLLRIPQYFFPNEFFFFRPVFHLLLRERAGLLLRLVLRLSDPRPFHKPFDKLSPDKSGDSCAAPLSPPHRKAVDATGFFFRSPRISPTLMWVPCRRERWISCVLFPLRIFSSPAPPSGSPNGGSVCRFVLHAFRTGATLLPFFLKGLLFSFLTRTVSVSFPGIFWLPPLLSPPMMSRLVPQLFALKIPLFVFYFHDPPSVQNIEITGFLSLSDRLLPTLWFLPSF